MDTPGEKYARRERRYDARRRQQEKAERRLSHWRLLVFVTGAGVAAATYVAQYFMLLTADILTFTVIFIYFVVRHERLKKSMRYTAFLREINHRSRQRLEGAWPAFTDNGLDFLDINHRYAADLDIFGKNSLFQWINTASTYSGRRALAALLSGATGDMEAIRARQAAVEELAPMLSWRQRFGAEGMFAQDRMRDPADLIDWARERQEIFRQPRVIALARLGPVVTVLLVLAGFALQLIPWHFPAAALGLQFALLAYKSKERQRMLSIAEKYADDLKVYEKMLRLLAKGRFQAPLLKKIKAGLKDREGREVYRQLDRLAKIIDAAANRRNFFYVFFNILLLLDFQHLIALERWKQQSARALQNWFEALGQIEALASLAVIRFDHPDWAKPEICAGDGDGDGDGARAAGGDGNGDGAGTGARARAAGDEAGSEAVFAAAAMGHPLLIGKRVHNDLAIAGRVKVLLITGSNMSGKSTLLRTAGINLVLAYAGAPVCAARFRVSLMEIHTCMRVRDDLGENISSFYAELLRIKEIVSAAKAGEKVFFLFDEIFKGTNSLDRHTGARVLLNKLSETRATGLVSTHDLELCALEQENDRIANYHFQEYYQNGRIHFDYRLRPGPSTTRNALYLMQLAGIDVE